MGLFGGNKGTKPEPVPAPQPIPVSAPAAPSGESTKNIIAAAYDEKGIRYTDVSQDGAHMLKVGFGLENIKSLQLFVFVDSDGKSYVLRSGVIASVPAEKRDVVIKLLNDLNMRFRWIRLFIDDDNDIMAQEDIDFTPADAPDLPVLSLMRAASILDDEYPEIMRAIWA